MAGGFGGNIRRMAKPRICLVTPASAGANNGNWHTADRWAQSLGAVAEMRVAADWTGEPADALIALHARRSAAAIERFRRAHAQRPIALVLTGTDLYRDLDTDASAQRSLVHATHIVVLQEMALHRLGADARAKARCIVQSAPRIVRAGRGSGVEMVAVGHLRAEKDPLTLMRAAQLLPASSPVRIVHVGDALDPGLAEAARRTMAECARYAWIGGLAAPEARERIARAHALVHMSVMEGGANVVIEAVQSGVPVLASRIDGNVGLLGADYAGYFEAADAAGLARLMDRFAGDLAWRGELAAQCTDRAPLFEPEREAQAVRQLAADMLDGRPAAATMPPPAVPKDTP